MKIWQGSCIVHNTFPVRVCWTRRLHTRTRSWWRIPNARKRCCAHADFIGSTSAIIDFCASSPAREFIVMTESGVNFSLERVAPGSTFHYVANENCNCSECPFMRLNTLEKLRDSLLCLEPRVELLPDDLIAARWFPSSVCWQSSDTPYRQIRPRSRQPAHQRDRPLQHPLLLLHAEEGVQFMDRKEILSFEEIERFVRAAVPLGITKLRITGGEPLVRRDLPRLIEKLAAIEGIRDIALTTNAVLLQQQAKDLYSAGLRRLNIHLDTLDRERFRQITRRDDLPRVLAGIDAAVDAGFEKIKFNIVAVKGLVEPDIVPMARYCRERGFEPRYIEFMPLDSQSLWDRRQGSDCRRNHRHTISREIGPLVPVPDAIRARPPPNTRTPMAAAVWASSRR
jgi:uncharacterized Fe-S cluster-containing radical SAM superfamily protein